MADLSDVTALAKLISENPTLAAELGERDPQSLEQVLRVSQAPFLSFMPYGKLEAPYSCQVAPSMSLARQRACVCGNRSGKTRFGLEEDWHDMLGIDIITKGPSKRFKPPIEIWVVSATEETSINIAQKTLADDVLGTDQSSFAWELVSDSTRYNPESGFRNNSLVATNGSRIDFKFSSQGRGTFQGTKKHKIHMDEEQPRDIYSECYARTIDHEGQILITFTPISDASKGMSWMFEELYVPREEKNIEFFNWSIYDNPYLSQAAKDDLVSQWAEDEMEARAHGMFTPMGMRLAFGREIIRQQRLHSSERYHTAMLDMTPQGVHIRKLEQKAGR